MEQEGKTKLPAYQVTSTIRGFYSKTDLAQAEMKTSSVLRNYIDNYQVFRDFYEGRKRYITFTSLGRELLGLVTERISDNPRLSGLSIEQFFNDIFILMFGGFRDCFSLMMSLPKAKVLGRVSGQAYLGVFA